MCSSTPFTKGSKYEISHLSSLYHFEYSIKYNRGDQTTTVSNNYCFVPNGRFSDVQITVIFLTDEHYNRK